MVSGFDLICPTCRTLLAAYDERTEITCPGCGRCYPVENGVIRFIEKDDDFYEGVYENQINFKPCSERVWHIWPLWLINSGYPWMVRHYIPAGSTVVELGCAGGVRYFGDRYRMIGCDLSYSALRKLDNVYEACLQADASSCLPLSDNSVDAVVSSFFWEHIPPAVKPRILLEISRILRPGGKLVFLYDVDTENPFISYYKKKSPALYRRLFIEGDGHLGYQQSMDNLSIFKNAGFREVKHQGIEKTWLQSPAAYAKLAQFGTRPLLLGKLVHLLQSPPVSYLYTALLRLTDSLFSYWLPKAWARIDLVVFEKDCIPQQGRLQ